MGRACYSRRLDEAIALATDAFRGVERKGSGVPFLSHLLQVMVYVAEGGGDEDQLIAAVLHDYLEDIDGSSADELAAKFGPRVASMVESLSDTVTRPKPPWKSRKLRYLAHLRTATSEVKLICCADKLHNAQSLRRDLRTVGDPLWTRFNASRDQTLWYYQEVVDALGHQWEHALLVRLRGEVAALMDEASPRT